MVHENEEHSKFARKRITVTVINLLNFAIDENQINLQNINTTMSKTNKQNKPWVAIKYKPGFWLKFLIFPKKSQTTSPEFQFGKAVFFCFFFFN